MKLFPGLFYFACVILLGARLRPLHHSTSTSITTVLWWQRELDLWLGWTYRLLIALITWLRKPAATTLPLTISDSGHTRLPLWRVDGHVKSMISRSLDVRTFYAPLSTAVGFVHRTAATQLGDQTKELMYCIGGLDLTDERLYPTQRKVLVVCQTASHPLLEPGPGTIPLITELEELGSLAGQV